MPRFTLQKDRWYACELIGDFFAYDVDLCSYSAIKVARVEPEKSGKRIYNLHFYHQNYPAGVKNKIYKLQTIERGEKFILAKSDHNPPRFLQIYDITPEWLRIHFNQNIGDNDIQEWLERNA